MLNFSKIQAITLDLDDTLWPVWPTIARAEVVLQEWLTNHAPKTARLNEDAELKKRIRAEVNRRYPEKSHDLSFLRIQAIRESMLLAGDAPHLAEDAFSVFFAERLNVTLYEGVEQALARLAERIADAPDALRDHLQSVWDMTTLNGWGHCTAITSEHGTYGVSWREGLSWEPLAAIVADMPPCPGLIYN